MSTTSTEPSTSTGTASGDAGQGGDGAGAQQQTGQTAGQQPGDAGQQQPQGQQQPAADDAKKDDTPPGADQLGDPGKKALDAMKADRNTARQERDAALAELEALKAKAEGREAEHAAALEAKRVQDEALAKANQRILSAEVRAQAAGKIAPDMLDVLPNLMDLSSFEVGDDGAVDATAIQGAISDLITRKPSLAAQGGSGFQGSADQGARTGQPKSTDEQIAELQAAGKHREAAALKTEQLLKLRDQQQ